MFAGFLIRFHQEFIWMRSVICAPDEDKYFFVLFKAL